jgi:hypothetical protein
MAKEILLGILAFLAITFFQAGGVINMTLTIVPILLRPLIILLGLLVGFLQAYIFTVLAMFYIGGAIAGEVAPFFPTEVGCGCVRFGHSQRSSSFGETICWDGRRVAHLLTG